MKSEFEALQLKDNESIDEFVGKLTGLVNRMQQLGEKMENATIVRKLLVSVPDKFLQVVVAIQQLSDMDDMPIEEEIGRLKAYEEHT